MLPTHGSSRLRFISRPFMAAAAVAVLALGTPVESAAQPRSAAQVQAERRALGQKETDLLNARHVLNQWLNGNEHFLLDGSVLVDRPGSARLVLHPVHKTELDAILLIGTAQLDVPRDVVLRALIEKDRQVREEIRTVRLPEIERRLADIKSQFERLDVRPVRPVASRIPEGSYSYGGGNGTAEVTVWTTGELRTEMNWKPYDDQYTLTAKWDEKISKYTGTATAVRNHEYPRGDIPPQFKTFTVYLEYLPQRNGILITVEGQDRWRMNQVVLTPR